MRRRLVIGITGTFGSGKSTVADLFRRWGARVLDADRLAHEALSKDSESCRRIVKVFGRLVLKKNGGIDRMKLAETVFSNKSKRRRLERIIHPYVFKRIRETLRRIPRGMVAIEVPLLFETGFHRYVDRTLVVAASKQRLISRLKRKRHLAESDIEMRMKAQMPLASKKRRSDFIINNSNGLRETAKQARQIWARIKKEVRT